MSFGSPTNTLQIFPTAPALDQTTFSSGIPITIKGADGGDNYSIILYSPNLQIIASMDNTTSKATSTYESTVTQGFSFGSSQEFSITENLGVSIIVVSVKASINFALSFTEEWNSTITKSMKFTCPAGEQAYVYQGILVARIMQFSGEDAVFSWNGNASTALTQVLVTSSTPIGSAPSNPVTIQQLSSSST